MPMLMLKCKTCGVVFPGIYVAEGNDITFKAAATTGSITHTCSRGHDNQYVTEDYMDFS